MTSFLNSLLFFLVALGVLVTVHEFGHYWMARKVGVRVLRFSIGFGKPFWTRRLRNGTELAVAPLPLGGYVRMLDTREDEVAPRDLPQAFDRQPLWARSAVTLAGPLFNFLLAIVLYWLLAVIGGTGLRPLIGSVAPDSVAAQAGLRPGDELQGIGGRQVRSWDEATFALLKYSLSGDQVTVTVRGRDGRVRSVVLALAGMPGVIDQGVLLKRLGLAIHMPPLAPVLGGVSPEGPAARAGLRAGDRILAVGDRSVRLWDEVVAEIEARPGARVTLTLERDGRVLKLPVNLAERGKDGRRTGFMGAYARLTEQDLAPLRVEVRDPPWAALPRALRQTWDMSEMTLHMVARMLLGQASLENLSGPVSIAQYAGASASIGVQAFLGFLALVSISLGVLNLLPIPVLDGGHLLYYLVEFVKGSPVSEHIQLVGQQVGVALLLGLMMLALYNDFMRMFN